MLRRNLSSLPVIGSQIVGPWPLVSTFSMHKGGRNSSSTTDRGVADPFVVCRRSFTTRTRPHLGFSFSSLTTDNVIMNEKCPPKNENHLRIIKAFDSLIRIGVLYHGMTIPNLMRNITTDPDYEDIPDLLNKEGLGIKEFVELYPLRFVLLPKDQTFEIVLKDRMKYYLHPEPPPSPYHTRGSDFQKTLSNRHRALFNRPIMTAKGDYHPIDRVPARVKVLPPAQEVQMETVAARLIIGRRMKEILQLRKAIVEVEATLTLAEKHNIYLLDSTVKRRPKGSTTPHNPRDFYMASRRYQEAVTSLAELFKFDPQGVIRLYAIPKAWSTIVMKGVEEFMAADRAYQEKLASYNRHFVRELRLMTKIEMGEIDPNDHTQIPKQFQKPPPPPTPPTPPNNKIPFLEGMAVIKALQTLSINPSAFVFYACLTDEHQYLEYIQTKQREAIISTPGGIVGRSGISFEEMMAKIQGTVSGGSSTNGNGSSSSSASQTQSDKEVSENGSGGEEESDEDPTKLEMSIQDAIEYGLLTTAEAVAFQRQSSGGMQGRAPDAFNSYNNFTKRSSTFFSLNNVHATAAHQNVTFDLKNAIQLFEGAWYCKSRRKLLFRPPTIPLVETYDILRVCRHLPVTKFMPISELMVRAQHVTQRSMLHVLFAAATSYLNLQVEDAPTPNPVGYKYLCAAQFSLHDLYVPSEMQEGSLATLADVKRKLNELNYKLENDPNYGEFELRTRLAAKKEVRRLYGVVNLFKTGGLSPLLDFDVAAQALYDMLGPHPIRVASINPEIVSQEIYGITPAKDVRFYNAFPHLFRVFERQQQTFVQCIDALSPNGANEHIPADNCTKEDVINYVKEGIMSSSSYSDAFCRDPWAPQVLKVLPNFVRTLIKKKYTNLVQFAYKHPEHFVATPSKDDPLNFERYMLGIRGMTYADRMAKNGQNV